MITRSILMTLLFVLCSATTSEKKASRPSTKSSSRSYEHLSFPYNSSSTMNFDRDSLGLWPDKIFSFDKNRLGWTVELAVRLVSALICYRAISRAGWQTFFDIEDQTLSFPEFHYLLLLAVAGI